MTPRDVRDRMGEAIDCAAIRFHQGEAMSIGRPGRHHDLIKLMWRAGLPPPAPHDQGFITSTGRFVDREAAGQITEKVGQPDELYSEDMW